MDSTEQVRAQIRQLEAVNIANDVPLSGRVIHACHYLPIASALKTFNAAPPSPPATPPVKPLDVLTGDTAPSESVLNLWALSVRYGHAAMTSGIKSLAATHEQVIVGWTGDIVSPVNPNVNLPVASISEEARRELDKALVEYTASELQEDSTKKPTHYAPVWLDDKIAHGHYDGYCKQTLWPLFHYLLWQDVTSDQTYTSTSTDYEAYKAANLVFAQKIASVYKSGDLIWVHDYHLLLVPQLLREILRTRGEVHTDSIMIGLFVHTPFPSSEVYRCLPRRKEILDGMLGASLVCFQTYSYARHFLSSCVRVCGYETTTSAHAAQTVLSEEDTEYVSNGTVGVDVHGHVTIVEHCPVGIDAERVKRDISRPGIQPKLQALLTLYEGKKIIVGRDKLDVVKGVLQKLRAFQHLLATYPEWVGNVVMIQVTSPSLTDSPKLERQVSELVSQINGEYGSLDFIPVHHYHQTLKKDEFYALLSVADLALITPLRDGMNTTSMEFVIAQEQTGKNPSILSEFMGISRHMNDALLVNPWDLGNVASAINHGLLMSKVEKAERHARLYSKVMTHTSHTWASLLVKMLLAQMSGQGMMKPTETPYIDRALLTEKYIHAGHSKRLFLFDYDGTLAPIVKTPAAAIPSPEALLALQRLSADPTNVVYIISGRDGAFLEQHLGNLAGIGFSAEHGGFVREPYQKEWVNFTAMLDMSWMSEVEEIFKYYTERTTGSLVEMKKSSITWHFRSSDPEWGEFQCRQCQDLLENNLVNKRPIEVLVGKKNLEVRPIAVNKGEIVKRILYMNPDAEFIFCAGDDKTDEDMFRALLMHSSVAQPGQPIKMEAPLSVTLVAHSGSSFPPVDLAIQPEAIFTTAVGHSSKKTLASWHVTTPQEIVEHMLTLCDTMVPASPTEKSAL
ncbi:glycosyltransferase family 20 protein [Fistulina hepatica ATCC 64428]|uniref:Glycosyltransferase family 20 protein n=1 Tax=Fistulina hepatica ATCC 64428 TaxID=1128425 RepID=A0A0D7AAQ4_9AGAR|nr:glycosyltransferase family 20 protein [Fistulina hepatica ATCC 64428]